MGWRTAAAQIKACPVTAEASLCLRQLVQWDMFSPLWLMMTGHCVACQGRLHLIIGWAEGWSHLFLRALPLEQPPWLLLRVSPVIPAARAVAPGQAWLPEL